MGLNRKDLNHQFSIPQQLMHSEYVVVLGRIGGTFSILAAFTQNSDTNCGYSMSLFLYIDEFGRMFPTFLKN